MVDFSLTVTEFKDAVQKGLGRAYLAINPPVIEAIKEIILEASLFDWRYDTWSEAGRSTYMMQIAKKANLTNELLGKLLEPFPEEIEGRHKRLRNYLLSQFAREGEERAWVTLTQHALVGDESDYGAIEEVGAKGVQWLVNNVLPSLEFDERWRVKYWKEDCEDQLSHAVVEALDAVILEHKEFQDLRPKYKPRKRAQTLDEALKETKGQNFSISCIELLGNSLTEQEVEQVANLWLSEKNPRNARAYARLFTTRGFPFPLRIIVDRVKAGDPLFDFESILSYSEDPNVREFGLSLINQPKPDFRGYECLASSFLDSDIPDLAESLSKFTGIDHDDLHDLCTALRDMAETIPSDLRFPILEWAYENNPCSFCREYLASLMIEDGTLPEKYRLELPYDASADARKLVAQ